MLLVWLVWLVWLDWGVGGVSASCAVFFHLFSSVWEADGMVALQGGLGFQYRDLRTPCSGTDPSAVLFVVFVNRTGVIHVPYICTSYVHI